MDIVAENPVVSISFVKHVMLLAVLNGCCTSVPCLYYLLGHWEECGHCDRPLRVWLLSNSLLSLVQLPIRLLFALRMQYLRSRHSVALMTAGFHRMTSSKAWAFSKSISLVNYGWFVLGVFWTFTSGRTACPTLSQVCLGVITFSLFRIFVTVGSFYYHFPSSPNTRNIFNGLGGPAFRQEGYRTAGLTSNKLKLLPKPILARQLRKKQDQRLLTTGTHTHPTHQNNTAKDSDDHHNYSYNDNDNLTPNVPNQVVDNVLPQQQVVLQEALPQQQSIGLTTSMVQPAFQSVAERVLEGGPTGTPMLRLRRTEQVQPARLAASGDDEEEEQSPSSESSFALAEEVCSICISPYDADDVIRLLPSCSHFYHRQCIDQWLMASGTCPLCQRSVDPTNNQPGT